MKKVFQDNSEIAHLWAHGIQDEARKAGDGNFYFRGDTIYSYGAHFPVAKRLERGVYLMTTQSYSATTNGHICEVERAIPAGSLVLRCGNVDLPRKGDDLAAWKGVHFENLSAMGHAALKFLELASRARSRKAAFTQEAFDVVENANAYIIYFRLRTLSLESKPLQEAYGAFSGGLELYLSGAKDRLKKEAENERARLAKREAQRRIVKAEFIRTIPALVSAWEMRSTRSLYLRGFDLTVYLRLSQDLQGVETSHGANVPLESALLLFRACRAYRAGHSPALPEKVGHFSPVAIDSKGNAVIGCHKLDFVQMEKLFSKLVRSGIVKS